MLDAYNRARARLEQATAALGGRRLNACPALAYFGAGQKTRTYGWRFGLALEAALRDRDHYEHDAAIDHMLHLCTVSGFRTEDYADRLPSNAEQARKFWDSVYENANPPSPAPSGLEVVQSAHAEMVVQGTNKMLDNQPVRIDDRRSAQPQPVPPQRRSYMQVQRLSDLGIR